MQNGFELSSNKKSVFRHISCNGEDLEISVALKENGTDTLENINWKNVESTVIFFTEHFALLMEKAKEFIDFLVLKGGLYTEEEYKKIKGYSLYSLEIIKPFGPYNTIDYRRFELSLHFDSDYWIDTYGYMLVKFINGSVVGVERIQV